MARQTPKKAAQASQRKKVLRVLFISLLLDLVSMSKTHTKPRARGLCRAVPC